VNCILLPCFNAATRAETYCPKKGFAVLAVIHYFLM